MSTDGANIRPLLLGPSDAEQLKGESMEFPSITLTRRQLCDLELLSNGGFSPLNGFMGQKDYDSVMSGMRLADGSLWPVPVTLEVSPAQAEALAAGDCVALRDDEGFIIT